MKDLTYYRNKLAQYQEALRNTNNFIDMRIIQELIDETKEKIDGFTRKEKVSNADEQTR